MDKWYTDRFDPEYATETAKMCGPDFVGPIGEFLTGPITKLMLLGPPAEIAVLQGRIGERFAGEIAQTSSDAHMLQIMSPQSSMAGALAKVAAGLGVAAANVLAIGDARNDVEMMRWAGLAAAPENAWPEARAAADVVVPSNDDEGVAVALERLVLGEREV
jgi:hydroxymethylpyrimidine pyrophosphatase-like HAD family hydrolase